MNKDKLIIEADEHPAYGWTFRSEANLRDARAVLEKRLPHWSWQMRDSDFRGFYLSGDWDRRATISIEDESPGTKYAEMTIRTDFVNDALATSSALDDTAVIIFEVFQGTDVRKP